MSKWQKDERRLANARVIGQTGVDLPFTESDFSPQVAQLRAVALERSSGLAGSSWSRSKLLAWLNINPPDAVSNAGPSSGAAAASSGVAPKSPPALLKFRWNKDLEARLVSTICNTREQFLLRNQQLTRQQLDAGRRTSVYWEAAATRFNDASYNPVNEYNHIPLLSRILPTQTSLVPVTAAKMREKFLSLRADLTKCNEYFTLYTSLEYIQIFLLIQCIINQDASNPISLKCCNCWAK